MIISKGRNSDKRNRKKDFSKRPESGFIFRKKVCRFCKDNVKSLDYKDVKRLERFLTERGKIFSSRLSGNCAKHQRILAEAIKRARFMSLMPYTKV